MATNPTSGAQRLPVPQWEALGDSVSKAGVFSTFLLVGVVSYACGASDDQQETSQAASDRTVVAPAQVTAPPAASAPVIPDFTSSPVPDVVPYGVGPDVVTVTSVTDGDTFRVGDRRIRVIGIDSCETGTAGGATATEAARTVLSGAAVTLTSEPGVDRDRYGREVRYVTTSSGDFGQLMVPADHTGVYEGGNNASASYLAALRGLDGGRSCGAAVDAPPAHRQAPADGARAAAPATEPTTEPTTEPRPVVRQPSTSGGGPFANCAAARAAGAAPLHRGDPGYRPKLDRDGDGIACE